MTDVSKRLPKIHGLHPLQVMVSAFCLVAVVGWTGETTPWLHLATTVVGLVFGVERGLAFLKLGSAERRSRGSLFQVILAVMVFGVAVDLLSRRSLGADGWLLSEHVFILMSVMLSGIVSMISHQTRFTARAFHPGLVLIISFAVIIVAGALLLKMPRCTVPGQTCSWLDAFFTSTSAVCVTGLAVQNTATFFTTTGQLVILVLIQIGGLGIMTLTFFASVLLFEGLTLHDRLLLGKMIQENRLARVGQTLTFIVVMTFLCEGLGAAVLYAGLGGIADVSTRVHHSVFHAVSAFCNAGFSTLPDGMASASVHANVVWQGVIMALIVAGGLGALVNEDLTFWAVARMKRWFQKEGPCQRLRVHTRLVLVVNAILIFGGAAAILVTEFAISDGPENGGYVLTALFHSVTARTAGFNTVSMSAIAPLTAQMLMILMIIGGSPGGTAGGLRTTVVTVGLGHLWNQLRSGRRGMVVFNRTIPAETGSQALGLIFLTFLWLLVNFIIFQTLQEGSGIPESTLLFELVSSFATVGLSLDLTPTLSPEAKILLIVNMFVGRVGLMTVMASLIKPDTRPVSGKPQEDILLS